MIAIGSDHGESFVLKEYLKNHLINRGLEVKDVGCYDENSVDYPLIALKAAKLVASGECEYGIFICNTGVGISIASNKVKGVRCALCTGTYQAKMTRMHNNANMLALGAMVTGKASAAEIADAFLSAGFEGGRHERRVGQIMGIQDGEII